jgi:hypothetical protein
VVSHNFPSIILKVPLITKFGLLKIKVPLEKKIIGKRVVRTSTRGNYVSPSTNEFTLLSGI